MELARNRYSERYFDSRPVEQEKLEQILEAGRIAPTACNYQPQRIYVIRSEAALQKARSLRVSHYNAPLMLLVCYDAGRAWRNPGDQLYDNYCSGEQDATIAAASMMYAAEELGVHTLWLRGFDSVSVAEAFGLPENIVPVMMFSMGYPSERSHPHPWHTVREPLENLVQEL
ncbi:MAG: nitroreductase family protein [Oscillospiraceae bacterium]|nr:nitroreductase family protein [Oscillospiraceae bacterium]